MNNLEGTGVLVTRPNGEMLCEKIQQMGGSTVYLPTIGFALPHHPVDSLKNTDIHDWIIFISPRAVEYGLQKILAISDKTQIAAPGRGTATILQKAGFSNVVYPVDQIGSEGLLDLPVFSNPKDQQILLVRGEGGRDLLAETLVARGAQVTHLAVYRRVVPVYTNINEYVAQIRQKKINITVCTSGESLHNLIAILGAEHQSILTDMALVVVSQRLASIAKSYSFKSIFVADNASDQAIIDTVCFIKGNGYVR